MMPSGLGESYLETEEAQADLSELTSALKNGENLTVAVEALAGEKLKVIAALRTLSPEERPENILFMPATKVNYCS